MSKSSCCIACGGGEVASEQKTVLGWNINSRLEGCAIIIIGPLGPYVF